MRIILTVILMVTSVAYADLEVHEWGSIHIVTGTDKVTVGDISDDQSDLPPFVDVWRKQAVVGPVIMKKPILYFYTDKPTKLRVTVRFPQGIFTQWWPKVQSFYPSPRQRGRAVALKNGSLSWSVKAEPSKKYDRSMPMMKNHPWWETARDVDAATLVSSKGGIEKFLFYRGAGEFKPTLTAKVDDQGKFVMANTNEATSRDVYAIHAEKNAEPIIHYYTAVTKGVRSEKVVLGSVAAAAKHMRGKLEARGLFAKEAAGMVKIWQQEMLEDTGHRVLYMMTQAEIDKFIPLHVTPKPDRQVRVMMIILECLSPAVKAKINLLIKKLGSQVLMDRKAAEKELIETGRVGEAVLRSAYAVAKDPEVKGRLKTVIEKVTPKNPNP